MRRWLTLDPNKKVDQFYNKWHNSLNSKYCWTIWVPKELIFHSIVKMAPFWGRSPLLRCKITVSNVGYDNILSQFPEKQHRYVRGHHLIYSETDRQLLCKIPLVLEFFQLKLKAKSCKMTLLVWLAVTIFEQASAGIILANSHARYSLARGIFSRVFVFKFTIYKVSDCVIDQLSEILM